MMRNNLHLHFLTAILIMLGVSSCATDQPSSKTSSAPGAPTKAVEKEQQEKPNSPNDNTAKTMEGRATWYGPGLYGNKTASGDLLEKGTMTAAHSSLPLGTEVKVTRLDTNESVTVVINDRKPYKKGTVIDLAHGAADALDIDDDGTADVSIEVLD